MQNTAVIPALRIPLIFFFFWIALPIAQAQVVTTVPGFPTVSGPVSVYFDATQGTGGLAGYTGDVYAHTGLITSVSTSPSDWKHTKTSWGQNTADTRLVRVSPNEYRLDIADVRAYYGVTNPAEKILKLAFVFRSATSPYLEGKESGGADIFIDLFDSLLNVRFVQPVQDALNPIIVNQNSTVGVRVEASSVAAGIEKIELFANEALVSSTTLTDTLEFSFTASQVVKTVIKSMVTDLSGLVAADSFTVYVNPPIVGSPVPDGMRDGINYHADPTTVTLVLQAPNKSGVYVIGDFNNWEPLPSAFLNRDFTNPNDVRWWITLDGLSPGTEYAFQYLVDGEIRIADPYSEKILDQFNDSFIDSATYPSLKPYPGNKTNFAVGVLKTGQSEWNWQAVDYVRPPQENLVIYELLLRDFIGAHNYQTLTDTLSYLERLGVNAIELMPVQEFDGNDSWGYNPAFLFAPDKYYGTEEALKSFIDECHKRGIAVILDVVLNHMTGQSPFVRLYNEGDYGPPLVSNPWVNPVARHPFNVFYDVNHESELTQRIVDRFNEHWLTRYNVDGFRYDLSKGFTQRLTTDVGIWGNYDASRVALLKRMADYVWSVDPSAYVILEHFGSGTEERELAHYRVDTGSPGMMLWNNMNHAYNEATMGYHTGGKSNFSGTWFGSRAWTVANTVTYMESHDEQWMMFKNLQFGNSGPDYNIKDLHIALERQKMAGAFFFTVPGPRMIWQFGELGYGGGIDCLRPGDTAGDCPANAPSRVGRKPIRWNYQTDPLRDKLYRTWSALIRLRNENPVFSDPMSTVQLNVSGSVKRITLEKDGVHVVIVGNFDVTAKETNLDFPDTGRWYRFFEADSVEVTDTQMMATLLPGQFFIFTNQRMGTPGLDLITVDLEDNPALPESFRLQPNYPNPFNPTTTVSYQIPTAGHVKLDVIDLLGRQVDTLVDGWQPAGSYAVHFDGTGLPSGTYIYRLVMNDRVQVRKMSLVK